MRCPHCDSLKHRRYRTPRQRGPVLYRRHQCSNCGLVFMTAEVVVEGKAARALAIFEDLI